MFTFHHQSRINNRELGDYVAKDIISRHLTQHDPDYIELSALQSEFDNERTPSTDKVKFHRFNFPKIFDYLFPASIHYFHCAIPSASQTESFLVTGPSDEMNQRVCALKVTTLSFWSTHRPLGCSTRLCQRVCLYSISLSGYL